jgi:hypothetical protein
MHPYTASGVHTLLRCIPSSRPDDIDYRNPKHAQVRGEFRMATIAGSLWPVGTTAILQSLMDFLREPPFTGVPSSSGVAVVTCVRLVSRVLEIARSLNKSSPVEAVPRAQELCDALLCPLHAQFNVGGATVGYTTIRPLLKHVSPVTARYEALRIRYPHFGGISLAQAG